MLLSRLDRGAKVVIFVSLTCFFLIAVHLSNSNHLISLPKWRGSSTDAFTTHMEQPPQPAAGGLDDAQKASEDALFHSSDPPLQLSPEVQESPSVLPTSALGPAPKATASVTPEHAPCKSLPGGEDVLVVMRTGATEINDRLTAHLNTTFRCYPNLVIFSDYAEDFHGHEVHDLLQYIPQEITANKPEFQHYQHVLQVGRAGLDENELSGKVSTESSPTGNMGNAGWRLDKWKFLPMINQTYAMYPDKKWYLFVEPDTYIVWSNLLQWLRKLDDSKPFYYGSEVLIGDDIFAHGGTGFVISNPAMKLGHDYYNENTQQVHELTGIHWAGDCVLGITLRDAGVPLTHSYPMFQGGNPSISLNWGDGHHPPLWCAPALSYHHMNPSEVQEMWEFEQTWIAKTQQEKILSKRSFFSSGNDADDSVLRHRDMFQQFVLPQLRSERMNWNNSADALHESSELMTIDGCRAICEADKKCLEYALGPEGCFTGSMPRTGRAYDKSISGWMPDRLGDWMDKLNSCWGKEGWLNT